MNRRAPPVPPRPDLERRPSGAFGWLDAELLRDGWLAELGPHATAVLVLLALAADRRGASFFGRDRMAQALAMSRYEIDGALQRLRDAGLVDHRPWRSGSGDGVWQILPISVRRPAQRSAQVLSAADVLRSLGFQAP
jgi:hypothetical protein